MSTKSEIGRGALSRRSFLKTSAGVALAGATGSLALSKTRRRPGRRAGGAGPHPGRRRQRPDRLDDRGAEEAVGGEGLPDPHHLCAGFGHLPVDLPEPRRRRRQGHRRHLQRGRRADQGAGAELPRRQVHPDLRRPLRAGDAERGHGVLRLLSRLLPVGPVRGQGLEDRQDRLYRRRQPAAAQCRPQRDEGGGRVRSARTSR